MSDWVVSLSQHIRTAADAIASASAVMHSSIGSHPSDDTLTAIVEIRAAVGLPAYGVGDEQVKTAASRWPTLANLGTLLQSIEHTLTAAAAAGRIGLLPRPPRHVSLVVRNDAMRYGMRLPPSSFGAVVLLSALPVESPWRAAFSAQAVLARIDGQDSPGDFPEWISRELVYAIPDTGALNDDQIRMFQREREALDEQTTLFVAEQERRKADIEARKAQVLLNQITSDVIHENKRVEERAANQVRYR